jgi:hypothetical protein
MPLLDRDGVDIPAANIDQPQAFDRALLAFLEDL